MKAARGTVRFVHRQFNKRDWWWMSYVGSEGGWAGIWHKNNANMIPLGRFASATRPEKLKLFARQRRTPEINLVLQLELLQLSLQLLNPF